ncbi:MAG: bifunctional riboflavin kinase/FAD synthetase [Leptospirales bacterium]
MLTIESLRSFNSPWKSCAITMGNFDGIHLGHQKLISRLLNAADEPGVKPVVIVYEIPHDDNSQKEPRSIFSPSEKVKLLKAAGVENVLSVELNQDLRNISAHTFLNEILIERLKAHSIIIGYDHRFGKDRLGDFNFLLKQQEHGNFETFQVEEIRFNNKVVSSSLIRNYILSGRLPEANHLLLKPFFVDTTVIHGNKRGKKIGFPTANLNISKGKIYPPPGVYFTAALYKGVLYKALTNIGTNPTFDGTKRSIETHILNFNNNIYDENLTVFFLEKIREEMRFSDVSTLQEQIQNDIKLSEKFVLDNIKNQLTFD